MDVRPLPLEARRLCMELRVPERLQRHLLIVHEVASRLIEWMSECSPGTLTGAEIDAVLFGAATHDLAKVLHPDELIGPGHLHERDGAALLQRLGVEPAHARFARTHGTWRDEHVQITDLLVALADTVWKGKRDQQLEDRVVDVIGERMAEERWAVFERLDRAIGAIADDGERWLAWQRSGGD
jgi:hypothetical protein